VTVCIYLVLGKDEQQTGFALMARRAPPIPGEAPAKKRAPRQMPTDEICPDDLQALFGRNFQVARLKSKLTLEDVAVATGMANQSISRIGHGKTNLTLATMKKLAAVVGMDVSEMVTAQVGRLDLPLTGHGPM